MTTLIAQLLVAPFVLPALSYNTDALEPVISAETVELHHGKHLQTYVTNLNNLLKDSPLADAELGTIVAKAPAGPLYNNAGQVLNHILYFEQFRPVADGPETKPTGELAKAIDSSFGSFEEMKKQMSASAVALFGSGWCWLAQQPDGKLVIVQYPNGGNPVRDGLIPLLGIDVWEHAYYVDYRNRRADHVTAFWNIVDWQKVAGRMK